MYKGSDPKPPKAQSSDSFEDISQLIYKHLEERDWLGDPPRGLAISIALEANELLEHYQWSEEPVGTKNDLAGELADIFIYAFGFAHANDIDIANAIRAKLEKSAQKYPAAAFKNKSNEEMRAAWLDAKLKHQKEGL
jgi:NTP pyrophosphatase (non-canonical NTP hydrolase)